MRVSFLLLRHLKVHLNLLQVESSLHILIIYLFLLPHNKQVSQQVGESNLLVNEHRNASPLQTISHSFDNVECTSSSHQAREVSPSCFPISDNVARHSMIPRSKVGIVKPNRRYALSTAIEDVTEPTSVKATLSYAK